MNMRKWIYKTLGHVGTVTTELDGDTIELESGTELCVASDVASLIAEHDARSKRYMDALDARDARMAELETAIKDMLNVARGIGWFPTEKKRFEYAARLVGEKFGL